jgi:hypothetical protein
MTIKRTEKLVEHGWDYTDQDAEGVTGLKRLVDLQEGNREKYLVH